MTALRTLLLTVAVCAVLLVGGCLALPTLLGTFNPDVSWRVPGAGRVLYLTVDDGPSEATPLILDVLNRHDVKATFFITTDHLQPEMMSRIVAGGHQIANHLKTTASLGRLSPEQFESDLSASERSLAPYRPVKLFRPPGGSLSPQQAAYVRARGYGIVVGTIYPLDHWLTNVTAIRLLAESLVIDGGIIILHDTRTRGPRTAEVLDSLIPQLKRRGYQFELLPANLTTTGF